MNLLNPSVVFKSQQFRIPEVQYSSHYLMARYPSLKLSKVVKVSIQSWIRRIQCM